MLCSFWVIRMEFEFCREKSEQKESMRDYHYHSWFEIYYMVSGSCRYFVGDQLFSVNEGDMILIPRRVLHKTAYLSGRHERILLNFPQEMIGMPLLSEVKKTICCTPDKKRLLWLLTETNRSVCEIAYDCGFHDSNYFSALFSRHFGISPLKFRKRSRT